jgi:hypothetical protein
VTAIELAPLLPGLAPLPYSRFSISERLERMGSAQDCVPRFDGMTSQKCLVGLRKRGRSTGFR